jgi:hypothetical protein
MMTSFARAPANFTAGQRAPSGEIRAEFHPLVTPVIPLVTRSSPIRTLRGTMRREKEKR